MSNLSVGSVTGGSWLNFTARRYASAVYAVVVCLSVLHKPVLYENGSTKGADFWHSSFLPPILHCYKEIRVSPEIRHFPIEICPKLRTLEISPRPVDRVVNKTRRRRRRRRQWSLLTTPGTVDESWLFTYTCRSTVNGSLCYFDLLWICCSTCFYN